LSCRGVHPAHSRESVTTTTTCESARRHDDVKSRRFLAGSAFARRRPAVSSPQPRGPAWPTAARAGRKPPPSPCRSTSYARDGRPCGTHMTRTSTQANTTRFTASPTARWRCSSSRSAQRQRAPVRWCSATRSSRTHPWRRCSRR